jgi:hypothetical protein
MDEPLDFIDFDDVIPSDAVSFFVTSFNYGSGILRSRFH